ncbi:MAG: YdeI/OmpD-associated family protein [Candidatus Aminicenantes bacterium]|nr:YdeI/OmpD-associated family protein [Candidatus Aminicenantes bacterium]
MGGKSFSAKLVRMEGVGTWTYLKVPFDVEKAFGKGGPVKVKGTVDGIPFHSSLLPNGDGNHFMVVPKPVRDKAKVKIGDRVKVVVEPDAAPRLVEAPPDLAKAIARNKAAKQAWDGLAPSHRKAYIEWIVEAKKVETRARRVEKAAALMAEKKPLK